KPRSGCHVCNYESPQNRGHGSGKDFRSIFGILAGRMVLSTNSINTTTFVASIFGSGEARRGSIPRSGVVTEEQRSQNRKATQPSGRRFFLAQTSLLTPYRPLKGMRVVRALSGPKTPRRKRGRIYGTGYLGSLWAGHPIYNAPRTVTVLLNNYGNLLKILTCWRPFEMTNLNRKW